MFQAKYGNAPLIGGCRLFTRKERLAMYVPVAKQYWPGILAVPKMHPLTVADWLF